MTEFPPGPSGDFPSWAEAARLCTRATPAFLDQVFGAALAVARGEAVHVRDGSLFDEIVYSWPLLAGLMFAASRNGGKLVVLDYGGAIATTYLQNRRFLDRLESVDWHIVEQEKYCDFADRNLRHPRVHFHRSIGACLDTGAVPNVALLSAVLQMIAEPWSILSQVAALPVRHILIDRCPISTEDRDRLTVFRLPPQLYPNMTMPMWFFQESRLLAILDKDFELVERFAGFENKPQVPSRYCGYILERRAR